MSWLKLFKTATKPTKVAPREPARASASPHQQKPIGERLSRPGKPGSPIYKEDWDSFATPHRDKAREYIRQAKAFTRISEAKVTDAHLAAAKSLLEQCNNWWVEFEAEFNAFYFDTDAAETRAMKLHELAFEAEGEMEDAVRHLQDAIDWRIDPQNPANES